VRNVSFSSIDNKFPLVKVNFWDVGGDDAYVEIRNEFYKDTSGAFLVFDVSNRSSFENLKKWRNEFMEFSSADEKVEFVLIGNKIDSDRIVGEDEGANLAKEWNAKYYETSALTGDNVEEMFVDLFYNSLAAKFEEYTEPLHERNTNRSQLKMKMTMLQYTLNHRLVLLSLPLTTPLIHLLLQIIEMESILNY